MTDRCMPGLGQGSGPGTQRIDEFYPYLTRKTALQERVLKEQLSNLGAFVS
jgi:hypothetical protein